jgi:RNA-directed DNA polymerase
MDIKIKEMNSLVTPEVLANQLGVQLKTLWALYHTASKDITRDSSTNMPYKRLEIKTSSKVREVYSPCDRIRDIQSMLLVTVWSGIDSGEHSAAYESGMKLTDAGLKLQSHGLIVGLDFKNFFHSILRSMVVNLLTDYGYPAKTANLIAVLSCVRDDGKHFLPQGGISSAQIANRVAASIIDPIVIKYCEDNSNNGNYTYVRYSDNIYIGLDSKVTGVDFLKGLATELYNNKWRTHKKRVMPYYRRQKLLGMVVNVKPNAPREEYNKFLCAIHNIANCKTKQEVQDNIDKMRCLGIEVASGKGILLLSILGKASYYRTILNQNRANKLLNILQKATHNIESMV